MAKLFDNRINCCGCELCAHICPVSIISMKQDEEGFFYPTIEDDTKCIKCNRCVTICPEKYPIVTNRNIIKVYTGFAQNEFDIRKSSSGGIATQLSLSIIEQGGVVYGVKYTGDCRGIIYSRATHNNEIELFRTSKYAQSRKNDIYKKIIADLRADMKVLFIGLPCDVAAINNLTNNRSKNLYTIELICHGVTSPKVHKEIIDKEVEKEDSPMVFFSVRYKNEGWKPYYIFEKFSNGTEQKRLFSGSPYDTAFVYLKRPSCNFCKFKLYEEKYGLQADLTIGDNHGVGSESNSYNKWGSSVIFVHTEKGVELINNLDNRFFLNEDSINLVRNNLALYSPFPKMWNRSSFSKAFVKNGIDYACNIGSVKFINAKGKVDDTILRISRFLFRLIGLQKYKSQCFRILGMVIPKYRKVKIQKP